VRRGGNVVVYVNSCPHIGTPLDWLPDRFLSLDGSRIVCATHGAEFTIEDGECLAGPCLGERLDAVMIEIKDGLILVCEDAGPEGSRMA
jgi:nitrite reductase/ring-hydroxylating ferredoxin subunit